MNGATFKDWTPDDSDPALQALLNQDQLFLERLSMLAQVLDWFKEPSKGMDRIIAFFDSHPALTARTLELANSPYYGATYPIEQISQASAILGAMHFSRIVAAIIVLDLFSMQ